MYEVEIKAILRLGQRQDVENWLYLNHGCKFDRCVYYDTYFDTDNYDLTARERELRLRKVSGGKQDCTLLTYKESPFDWVTRSKAEHQIEVDSYSETLTIIKGLGLAEDITFEKHCSNGCIAYNSYQVQITLAQIPELDKEFIELEISVPDAEAVSEAMNALNKLVQLLKINPDQITSEYYTDLIRNNRLK